MINNEAKIQVLDDRKGGLWSRIQIHKFSVMETASEYKHQIATETVGQNTSK